MLVTLAAALVVWAIISWGIPLLRPGPRPIAIRPGERFEQAIQDPVAFVAEFDRRYHPPARDKYETDAEYGARMHGPFDPSVVFYFALPADHWIPVDYSLESSTIVVSAWPGSEMCGAQVASWRTDQGSYPAANQFGASVDVETYRQTVLTLQFAEGVWSPQYRRLRLSVRIDRARARDIERDLRLILGVAITGGTRSNDFSGAATWDAPRQRTRYDYRIDTHLRSVDLVNLQSREHLAGVRFWRA